MSKPINVVLGTMNMARQVDKDGSIEQIKAFIEALGEKSASKKVELDTALMYPARETEGLTEQLLKEILKENPEWKQLYLATKANPWGDHSLSSKEVHSQANESLQNLGLDCVDLFYLHAPDLNTPIEETLQAVNELYTQGKIKEFGLSNYASWQVAEICGICDKNGWIKPTVYQGMYNAITRNVEAELFPCLRRFGLRFYAYNATAGGLLCGKYNSVSDVPKEGRFALSEHYRDRFWSEANFEALALLRKACEAANIAMPDAANRWLANHSALDATLGDAVIVGASKTSHVRANTAACRTIEPLPQTVLDAFDNAWQVARPHCIKYFRP